MPFLFKKTDIEGLVIIEPHCSWDERGTYKKFFEENVFKENGLPTHFTESSDILSSKGVLRGLHFQTEWSQGKLIHVISGEIFDVVLDLRKDSTTFGHWEAFYLNAIDSKMLYIPENFAHGFLSLQANTVFSYQSTNKYVPTSCGGILWNDKDLMIPWPIDRVGQVILSEKDKCLQTFAEYKKENLRNLL
jgi:dTDP-4-dehydrorhamnose 3,5-epimerase